MKWLLWAVLALVIMFGLNNAIRGCVEQERRLRSSSQAFRYVRIYSADNLDVVGGANFAFAPDDPKHMTIALRSRPAGDVVARFKDHGSGMEAEVIRKEMLAGARSVKVKAANGERGFSSQPLREVGSELWTSIRSDDGRNA